MSRVWVPIASHAACAALRAQQRASWSALSCVVRQQCTTQGRPQGDLKVPSCANSNIVAQCRSFSSSSRYTAKEKARASSKKASPAPAKGYSAPRSPHPKTSKPSSRSPPPDAAKKSQGPSQHDQFPPTRLSEPAKIASHVDGIAHEAEPLTWRDYDPEGGMPPRAKEFTKSEIAAVFGRDDLDADVGNYVLNTMHYRRVSGSIIESGYRFPEATGVSEQHAKRALEYLREVQPGIDEQRAVAAWAEEEVKKEEQKLIERGQRLGLLKKTEPEPDDVPEEQQQGTSYGRAKTGESSLIAMRKAREAQYEQEQAEKMSKQQREQDAKLAAARGPLSLGAGVQPETTSVAGGGGVSVGQPQRKAALTTQKRREWYDYHRKQANLIKGNTIPQMSLLRRLGPSALFALAVVLLAIFLSDNYTPPPKSARIFPDTSPAVATLSVLTATILIGFIGSRFPPFWRAANKYLTIVVAYPRAVSLIGCAFRHESLVGMLPNIAAIWLFGLMLHEDVGRGTFLGTFFGTCALGGLSALTFNTLTKGWQYIITGSSGAAYGVIAASCTLHPTGHVKAFGYDIPVAAWMLLVILSASEVVALARFRGVSKTDHAGHIGGIISGLAAGMLIRAKARRVEMEEAQTNLTEAINAVDS